MSDANIVVITGRLVRDPILRRGESGNLWGVFTLAANYRYKDKGGNSQEETAFVPCKAFGGWAESLAKHKKGDTALVEGRVKTEAWEKNGQKHSQLTVICDSLKFIMLQNGSPASASIAEKEPAMDEAMNGKDDQPPF